MRGATNNFEMMSSTCVQNVAGGGIPHNLAGGAYESAHMMEARSPAPAWHHMNTTTSNLNATLSVKQEPVDHDSSAYGSGSDGFHSSSPGASDHSRDSNPPSIPPYSTAHLNNMHMAPFYSSTPLANHIPVSSPMQISYHHQMQQIHQQQLQQQQQSHGFNPLTPPSFEPMVSPKTQTPSNQEVPQVIEASYQQIERDPNTTLTPCTTPPSEPTPPKSPKSPKATHSEEDDSSYFSKTDGEDHLRRLQMAFERNGMLPESPKGSENRDSGEEDGKSDYEMDEVDEQGLRIPRVNSHGKVKVFKCKQCEFVAVTKLDFWEHSRGHIKAEKLLTCPKCPFVTEYKHHLEYHLRNHFGSKPFKCDKCSYSCVNKSMLNSHLKSHSNVYQYRCADCTYATKYCHSLKLHLRKYKHSPAMVLNPDGTPNPLPIIDVYGTRRGPKQKNGKGENETITTPNVANSPPIQPGMPPHSIFPHFMMNSPQSLPFPYGPMLAAFPGALNNPLLFPQMNPGSVSPNPSNGRSTPESLKIDENSMDTESKEDQNEEVPKEGEDPSTALDLSKPEISLPINIPEVPIHTPIANPAKNRRKGRAFKLERISQSKEDASEDEDFVGDKSEEKIEEPTVPADPPKVNEIKKTSDIFNCQYCDIAFRDVVMYTMHMGYHGYKDPFTCNMCGEQSADKLSFFLHIARTSHS